MPSSRWPYGPAHEQPPRALDAEQVVEQGDDEVVVQVAAAGRRTTNDTIDSRSASRLPRISMPGWPATPRSRATQVRLLVRADRVDADGLLELEHQPGADRLDDRRRAALLAVRRVVEVAVLVGVDVGDRAAAGHVGHPVA